VDEDVRQSLPEVKVQLLLFGSMETGEVPAEVVAPSFLQLRLGDGGAEEL
jgi:hypothetical protein